MKLKIIALFLLLLSFSMPLFTQDTNSISPSSTQLILPQKQYSKLQNVDLKLYYYEYVGEARVIYIVDKLHFSQEDAIISCRAFISDFMSSHTYYHYKYLRDPDVQQYSWSTHDNTRIPIVKYIVFVKFYY